jgi:hypothetical protein
MTLTGKYVLRDVLGVHFVVPVDRSLGDGRKCFELSAEGADIWRAIECGGDISMYDEEEIREFVDTLKSLGVLT